MDVEVLDNFFVKDSVEVPSSTMEKSCQVCTYFCQSVFILHLCMHQTSRYKNDASSALSSA